MLRSLTKQGWVTCRHAHRALNPGNQFTDDARSNVCEPFSPLVMVFCSTDLSAANGLALFSALRHERQTGMHMSGNRTATLPLSTLFLPCLLATHEARGLASDASINSGQNTQAKAIKKGLSAGTVPPATEQVPASVEQHQEAASATTSSNSKTGIGSSSSQTVRSSAMVGKDRPSASAVPAGVDQVPPSMVTYTASQPSQGGGPQSNDQDAPSTSAPQSQQSMQSVMADISDVGQLGKAQPGGKAPSAASNMQGISRWQRFKWWIWGTPQQYWTDQDGASSTDNISDSSKDESGTSSSSTDAPGSSKEWKRSKYTLGDIIGSAILQSGITKDEDIARYQPTLMAFHMQALQKSCTASCARSRRFRHAQHRLCNRHAMFTCC